MDRLFSSLLVDVASLGCNFAAAQNSLDDLRTDNKIVTWSESDLPAYSIQVLATQTPPSDASFVKSSDVLYEYKTPDGYLKYFYGKFSSYAEANKQIKAVKSKGYDGAFIVGLKKGAAAASSKGIVTTGNKPIEIDPNKDYVVQIGAYRFPLYISFFENVGTVYEYRLNDKIFRYTTPPVKGSQVEAELSRVKALGYSAAFVVEYDTYAPYKIE